MSRNQYVREEQARIEKFVKREYWRLRVDGRFAFTRSPLTVKREP